MAEESHKELLVIGAGEMRTGTKSLKDALEYLLGAPCYHMQELAMHHRDHGYLWLKACEQGGYLEKAEWEYIFKEYRATVDQPGCSFYKELMKLYPNAKVILTVRDPTSWVKSVRATTYNKEFRKALNSFPINWLRAPLPQMTEALFAFATKGPYYDYTDQQWAEYFEHRNAEVIATVPKEKLLVYQVEEGWAPLCKFLNLPLPDESVPFPRSNDTQEFQQRIKRVLKLRNRIRGGFYLTVATGVALIAAWVFFKKK